MILLWLGMAISLVIGLVAGFLLAALLTANGKDDDGS